MAETFRVMDLAWYRDRQGVLHCGEQLMLACLFKVKKKRNYKDEESLKDVLQVFEGKTNASNQRSRLIA